LEMILKAQEEQKAEAPEDNPDDEVEQEEEEPEEEEVSEDEEEVVVPEVDNVVLYHPLNKEGKPLKTPVECTVVKVDTKKKVVDLQNMATQRLYKNVGWDAIKNTD
jgi:hypothetical protein